MQEKGRSGFVMHGFCKDSFSRHCLKLSLPIFLKCSLISPKLSLMFLIDMFHSLLYILLKMPPRPNEG